MKNTGLVTFILLVLSLPLQKSCAQTTPCPANNEQAKQYLIEYLNNDANVDDLKQKRGLNLTRTSFKKINILSSKGACSKLLENASWLENFDNYSFYKVDNYYVIVMYSNSNNKFDTKGFAIFNNQFERITTIMDF